MIFLGHGTVGAGLCMEHQCCFPFSSLPCCNSSWKIEDEEAQQLQLTCTQPLSAEPRIPLEFGAKDVWLSRQLTNCSVAAKPLW